MILANDLRKAVLQAAIQGKLTEQLETDDLVNDLLKSIMSEKKQLVKNGIIKKEKELLPIEEEEIPFDIPDNWGWVRLFDICSKIGAGSTPKGGNVNYVKEGIPFIREQNVYNDGLHYEGIVFIPNEINEKKKGSIVVANDILLNITGGSIGRCCLVPEDFCKGNVNQHVLIIRMINSDLRAYIHNVLMSPYIQGLIWDKQKGDKEGLSATSTKNFPIPIPPLAEQKRLITKINELMAHIDEYERIENELVTLKKAFPEDIKKSILQAAIQGKITEQLSSDSSVDELFENNKKEKEFLIKNKMIRKEKPLPSIEDDEIPFEIPETWRWVRLGDVICLTSGQDLANNKYNESGKGIPYLTGASNIENEKVIINRWTESPRAMALKGDLLLTCKGTVGTTCILNEDNVHIARQIMSIRPYVLNVDYIHIFIKTYVQTLKAKAKSMIPGIERKNVLEALIPVPPIQEQQRIVEKLLKLLPFCDDLKIE